MFTQFVKTSRALGRYRNGPFAQERQQFLTYLGQRGYRKSRLTGISIRLLAIAQRLPIGAHKKVTKAEISEAAGIWMKERKQGSSLPHTLELAKTDFISTGSMSRSSCCRLPTNLRGSFNICGMTEDWQMQRYTVEGFTWSRSSAG